MSAKFIRFFIISLLFALGAAGCGQKGPLFLPEDDARATADQPASGAESDKQEGPEEIETAAETGDE